MLQLQTAGESHGPEITGILSGFPSGVKVNYDFLALEMKRRRGGWGRSSRVSTEQDKVEFTGGIIDGVTTGSPVSFRIRNMVRDGGFLSGRTRNTTVPRPGHGDFAGVMKHGFNDIIPVSERASARFTAAVVAAGSLASMFLGLMGVSIYSWVTAIGDVEWVDRERGMGAGRAAELARAAESSAVYCPDEEVSKVMKQTIDEAAVDGDTLGGAFRVVAVGLPPGLGGYETSEDRLDGALAGNLMSIPSARGIFIGDTDIWKRRGGDTVGGIKVDHGRIMRTNGQAGGGIEGGMTSGDPVTVTVFLKPVPTLGFPVDSVDLKKRSKANPTRMRADTCVVPAGSVVGRAVVSFVLASFILKRFGDGPAEDIRMALRAYIERIGWNK